MNTGRICISVHAATISEFVAMIEASRGKSDLIELRFDSLNKEELRADDIGSFNVVMRKVVDAAGSTPCITTFRPKESGGYRSISELERVNFWNSGYETDLADLEEEVIEWSWSWIWGERICSHHDFSGVPADLDSIVERLARTKVDIVKIAATVKDVAEAIPIWRLLDRSKLPVIPIAMGEAGKWTRILGLAYGSPITYASPDDSTGTAPGQISARDMNEVYRVKDLDRETLIHGVVAGDTSYSLSPYMHNAAFKSAGLNSVFVPFQVHDLASFVQRMVRQGTREVDLPIGGLSVTNPHKQAIIPLLDDVDPTAAAIGAVNTVKVDGDRLIGFNTDAPGFIAPLMEVFGDIRGARVSVAGAGGAARACVYALKEAGADVTLLARDISKASSFAEEFAIRLEELTTDLRPVAADILVNATPLGTRGATESETVATADELRGVKLVYDLVYNPTETRLLHEAKSAGVATLGGLDMLIAQGVKQFEIWTGQDAPTSAMRYGIEKRLQ